MFSVRQFSATCGHQAVRQRLEKKKKDDIYIDTYQIPSWQFIIASTPALITLEGTQISTPTQFHFKTHSIAHLFHSCWESALTVFCDCRHDVQVRFVRISLIQALCCMTSRQIAEVHGKLDQLQTVDYSQVSELGHLFHSLFL